MTKGTPHRSKRGDEGMKGVNGIDHARAVVICNEYERRWGRLPQWKRDVIMTALTSSEPFMLIRPPEHRPTTDMIAWYSSELAAGRVVGGASREHERSNQLR